MVCLHWFIFLNGLFCIQFIRSSPPSQIDEVSFWEICHQDPWLILGDSWCLTKRNFISINCSVNLMLVYLFCYDFVHLSVFTSMTFFIQMYKGWTNHWRVLRLIFGSWDIQQPDIRGNFAVSQCPTISQYWKSCNNEIRISEFLYSYFTSTSVGKTTIWCWCPFL